MTTRIPRSAGKWDLEIQQGATFEWTFYWETERDVPKDLTGWTARASVRTDYGGSLIIELTCTIPVPANGEVLVSLTAEQTTALLSQVGVYDLELVNGATVKRLAWGAVDISPEATT
jgi:hypothetical protein